MMDTYAEAHKICVLSTHYAKLTKHLAGPGALSLGKALLTSTNLPSIVCSLAKTTSAANNYITIS